MTRQHAIQTEGLRKSYGDALVLDEVTLAAAAGSVFALLGPNGAGKTTLVRILATLARADSGTATVAGFDTVRDERAVRRRIALTGQFSAIDLQQTGAENLRMMARFAGLRAHAARRRAAELLDRFDLAPAADRRVATYSGGMQRRIDLAASLVVPPEVLFLDEPTTGLDPRSRQQMWSVVRDLVADGVTVFLTTQYLQEADQLADRVAVLDAGRVVADGTPRELKTRVAEQVLEMTMADAAGYRAVLTRAGTRAVRPDGDRLCVALATDGSAAATRALLDDVDPGRSHVAAFAVRSASLDDVFLALTGHAATPDAGTDTNPTTGTTEKVTAHV